MSQIQSSRAGLVRYLILLLIFAGEVILCLFWPWQQGSNNSPRFFFMVASAFSLVMLPRLMGLRGSAIFLLPMALIGILILSSTLLPGYVTTEWVGLVQNKYTTRGEDGETIRWLTVTKDGTPTDVIIDTGPYRDVSIGNTVRVRHIQKGMLAGYSIEILN